MHITRTFHHIIALVQERSINRVEIKVLSVDLLRDDPILFLDSVCIAKFLIDGDLHLVILPS